MLLLLLSSLVAAGRPLIATDEQERFEQRAFELHSDITAGFCPENELPPPGDLKLKAKQRPLLQLLGEACSLVEN